MVQVRRSAAAVRGRCYREFPTRRKRDYVGNEKKKKPTKTVTILVEMEKLKKNAGRTNGTMRSRRGTTGCRRLYLVGFSFMCSLLSSVTQHWLHKFLTWLFFWQLDQIFKDPCSTWCIFMYFCWFSTQSGGNTKISYCCVIACIRVHNADVQFARIDRITL